ncbi:4'-phosphopantetheinyl transferase superfamily protein [Mesorhizobium loti]|nr:4'-phosphopantetheinyl transferase superfamily protein [Mesorhizobium loti]
MKIMGLGSDLVSVGRIRHSLEHLGRPWANKILGPAELDRAPSWDNAEYVATLFAAKEACSKALGTGMTGGVQWTCIEIELPGTARLSKGALRRMNAIAGRGRQGLMIIDTFCKDGVAGATAIFFAVAR